MEFTTINIKEYSPTVEEAIANLEIAIDNAKKMNTKVLKIIHGYGSHGVGGAIIMEIKKILPQLKRQHKIKDYINGANWTIANSKTFQVITEFPESATDEDLNTQNIGITIILI